MHVFVSLENLRPKLHVLSYRILVLKQAGNFSAHHCAPQVTTNAATLRQPVFCTASWVHCLGFAWCSLSIGLLLSASWSSAPAPPQPRSAMLDPVRIQWQIYHCHVLSLMRGTQLRISANPYHMLTSKTFIHASVHPQSSLCCLPC